MRHQVKFDGMQAVDPGFTVSHLSAADIPGIQHYEGQPITSAEERIAVITNNTGLLEQQAYKLAVSRYTESFQEDDPSTTEQVFRYLCGPNAETPAKSNEDWRTGNALDPTRIAETAPVQAAVAYADVLDAAFTEMVKNIFRRLHAHEAPAVEYAFQVFQQNTTPLQVSAMLVTQMQQGKHISPADMMEEIKSRPDFWKAELQDLLAAYISALPGDPDAKSMQMAAGYQRIKSLFEPEEPEPEQPEKEKKPRRLKHRPKA